MTNDPYGLKKRESTIEGLQAQLETQHKETMEQTLTARLEGRREGRAEQLHSRELRQWCIDALIGKGEMIDAKALVEQASTLERFILGPKE